MQVQLAAACASFVAVMLYNYTLRDVPIRQLMLWGTLIAAGLQSSQLILVTGAHHALGLDDHLFVLGGSVVMNTIQNVSGGIDNHISESSKMHTGYRDT